MRRVMQQRQSVAHSFSRGVAACTRESAYLSMLVDDRVGVSRYERFSWLCQYKRTSLPAGDVEKCGDSMVREVPKS